MSLKTVVSHLDDVDEVLRGHYRKAGEGRFVLALDGDPHGYEPAGKVAEFRTNNRALNAKITELEAAKAGLQSKLDQTVADSATALQARPDLSPRVAELEAALAQERGTLAKTQLAGVVAAELHKAGVRPSAVEFMVAEAAKVFAFKDGTISTDAFSATKPGERLTVAEWVAEQHTASSFAFLPSSGGGAPIGGTTAQREPRTVSRDPLTFGLNLAAIASGDVVVR